MTASDDIDHGLLKALDGDAEIDRIEVDKGLEDEPFTPSRCPDRKVLSEELALFNPVKDSDILTAEEIVKIAFENVNSKEILPGIRLPRLTERDEVGTIGISDDRSLGQVCLIDRGSNPVKRIKWISDCIIFITTETACNDKTELTFEGVGAKDGRHVKFVLSGMDLADARKFKGTLINVFGANNRFGKMNFEYVQSLTNLLGNTRKIQRIEVPCWVDGVPMVPGTVPGDDVEFELSSTVPARVYDGDLEVAKDVLRDLLSSHKFAPIVVAVTLGAPAVARWRPDDRLAVAMWGLTGTMKTTFAKHCLAMYGTGYESDRHLIKSGGGSDKALGIAYSVAGILPVILDNVKSVDTRDLENYVKLVHMVIEGADRLRGTKDAGLKDSLTFLCSLIVTGEIRPAEASTDARVLNLTWTKPDLGLLRQIEEDVELLPVIGYHWLKFLSTTRDDMVDGFSEARAKYEKEFADKGICNPGRLASIYTVIRFTWNLLLRSPLGDVFEELTENFTKALDEAVAEQGDIVTNDTESSRFLTALDCLMGSQPQLFQPATIEGSVDGRIIGKHCEDGLFLLPEMVLNEMFKLNVFNQRPTVDSMTKALAAKGVLLRAPKGKRWVNRRRINGRKLYGWLLKSEEEIGQ